jgi:hypothetical protein
VLKISIVLIEKVNFSSKTTGEIQRIFVFKFVQDFYINNIVGVKSLQDVSEFVGEYERKETTMSQ